MIERLDAHNFRCLENFSLDLVGRPSALIIGKNGSGKSSVLNCFRIFQRIGRGSGRIRELISASDFAQHRLDRPMRLAVELSLEGRRFRYEIAFEWPANFLEARVLEESLVIDGVDVFRRKHAQVQLAGGQSFGLDWHMVALPLINQRPGERGVKDLKEFFATMLLVAPEPSRMTGYAEEPSAELEVDAANFAACLRALLSRKPAAYSTFADQVKAAIPDFAAIENVERGERGTQLMVKFERPAGAESLAVEFKSLSDGEKCFFLAAYIVTANSTGPPVVCIWDQPDKDLSISEVGESIVGLRKMTNRGGQFIATTHHPETIRKFSRESTLVLYRKSHLEPTVVRPLADLDYQGDLMHALIRGEIMSSE
ncbi:MAG: AAA family ATPase [Isosphaeraceae bacterium]|nr:AAA family ATPase [Isosphaeraceae bacterium]